jgi:transposase
VYIRESKTTNKKTGEVYVKHQLVASVRTEKGPRNRVIMSLGTLTAPRIDWKRLAHALECRITGQTSLLEPHDAELELLALKLVSNYGLSKALRATAKAAEVADGGDKAPVENSAGKSLVSIDLDSVRLEDTRGLGAEAVCMNAWALLGLTGILKKLKLSLTSISLIMALVFGRLISPGSERHTIAWFRKRSALGELPGVTDLKNCGNDRFYNVADELYDRKERIEDLLYLRERELFPNSAYTVYLYDLTNTYFEGHGLGNSLAARGHCKSKRYDCPLVTLGMVVNGDGMPICSQIYKGNQSEPETMEGVMRRLSLRLHGGQIPLVKPTVAMDRGIATIDNVKWLRENGYDYVVIRREDDSESYRKLFEARRDAFELASSKHGIYGDDNDVYILKEPHDDADTCRVLCYSTGKERKEKAIAEKKGDPFLEDIDNLRKSIKKGSIKKKEKIENKLQRIVMKHGRKAANYETAAVLADGKITDISTARKTAEADPLYGRYVIESTHVDMSAKEIWKLYMTLTRVESAFRSMKGTLGMRPVYHQKAERTEAHLFITVLAYHLLAVIENTLSQHGDHRTWETLRDLMSTLVRGTVAMRDERGATYNLRISGQPEAEHRDILGKLGINSLPATIVSKIDTL